VPDAVAIQTPPHFRVQDLTEPGVERMLQQHDGRRQEASPAQGQARPQVVAVMQRLDNERGGSLLADVEPEEIS
jgi:hypothetical protein